MSLLPARREGQNSVELAAAREVARAELDVLRYQLAAQTRGQADQIDSQVLGDALRTSLDEEVATLTYGMSLADGNPAVVELTAQKVALQSSIDNGRIGRRFKG